VVLGQGFSGATSVSIEPSADTEVVAFNVLENGTRIDAIVDIAANAAPGLRRVRVLDAAAGTIADAAPGASQILLTTDLPRIDSVTPNLVALGETVELKIRGSNLRGLPYAISRDFDDQPAVRITPEEGISIGSEPRSNDEGTLVYSRCECGDRRSPCAGDHGKR
ncbi:MAG: hypothetical protein ABI650_11355, partial [Dokdonella sp.]